MRRGASRRDSGIGGIRRGPCGHDSGIGGAMRGAGGRDSRGCIEDSSRVLDYI